MKKSLMLISFAFIFLLTMSVVSASWFSDLFSERSTGQAVKVTGDIKRVDEGSTLPTSIRSSDRTTNKFQRTSGVSATSSARTNQAPQVLKCPRGWGEPLLTEDGKNCCGKAENKGRTTRGLFSKRV